MLLLQSCHFTHLITLVALHAMSHPALCLTCRAQNCTVLKIRVHQSFIWGQNSSPLFSVPFLVTPSVLLAYLVAAAHQGYDFKILKTAEVWIGRDNSGKHCVGTVQIFSRCIYLHQSCPATFLLTQFCEILLEFLTISTVFDDPEEPSYQLKTSRYLVIS